MSSQKKSWSELTKDECDEILKKMKCEVKVKLQDGRVFGFNPFKECASFPPQFNLLWLPLYNNEKPKRQFMFCDEVYRMVESQGIVSDNIDYLKECKFNTIKIQLNMNIENEQIWLMLKTSKNAVNLNDCDEYYKQQLIKGYTICKNKTYNFKSVEEEEKYFARADVSAEEEVYYYQFLVDWSEKNVTLSEIGLA